MNEDVLKFLYNNWPAPLSVILSIEIGKFEYLRPLNNTLAFRMPDNPQLQHLLSQTGPLVAPSANPQGLMPATTIEEAKAYFGESVDFYVDGGKSNSEPSTLVDLTKGVVQVIRQGSFHVAE